MSDKKRIMFVDDEENILSGLRLVLRSKRREWAMVFASSGNDALEKMAEEPCDVVVSDMRMPGMDGADLLMHVKETYPGTVRMILSGQAGEDALQRSIGSTHQYLCKPCNPEVMMLAVTQALVLRELHDVETYGTVMAQVQALPTFIKCYQEIIKKLEAEAAPADLIQRVSEIAKAEDLQVLEKEMPLVFENAEIPSLM
jgi:DNA-binding NtrC family response regulator